jgi:hypothetical protein
MSRRKEQISWKNEMCVHEERNVSETGIFTSSVSIITSNPELAPSVMYTVVLDAEEKITSVSETVVSEIHSSQSYSGSERNGKCR